MKRVAAGVAVAALLLAACGGGGGKKNTAAIGGSTTSSLDTSTTVADTSTTTAAGGSGTTTKTTKKAGTAGGATVNGQPASNYTPPAGATPAKPATPGTYHYDNQPGPGPNTFGAPPATSSLIVAAPQGTRQTSTNDMGSNGKTDTTLDYQPEGVHIVEVKVTAAGKTYDFVGNPPPLAAPTGVKPGQSVDFTLSDAASNTSIQVHIDFVRNETITIGGQPVNTIVIHQVGTLSGGLTGTQTSDSWVSTQYDLFVKTHSTGDVKQGPFEAKSDVTSTLEKLTPG